jgi:hypothetical protein
MTCDSSVPGDWVAFPFPGSWTYFNTATNIPDFTQPVQGSSFPNCSFVSALIALTWVNKDYIIDKMGPNAFANGYTFYDNGTAVTVKINNKLLVTSGSNRCGAVSKNYNEIWPCLIEKAYAKFCQYKMDKTTYDTSWLQNAANNPNLMSSLTREQWGGNPTTALSYLTGCAQVYNKVNLAAIPNCTTRPATRPLYDYIKICICTNDAAINVWRSVKPAAAWTFSSGAQFTGACGIFANHCYALLGIVENGGVQYIVLRDTFGVDPAAGCNIIPDAAPWTYMDAEYPICARYAVPMAPHASNEWKTRNFTAKDDAIFGLTVADFKKYFEWFGYVK